MQATLTVERVGRRIAEASGLKGCKWEFIVVKNDQVNAFVLPGGKVSTASLNCEALFELVTSLLLLVLLILL